MPTKKAAQLRRTIKPLPGPQEQFAASNADWTVYASSPGAG